MTATTPTSFDSDLQRRRLPTYLTALSIIIGSASCNSGHPAESVQTYPNVLFIVIDTLRQDHVGCYGAARGTTPAIDALASESSRFERAYATAPWTMPSVASMFSGRMPSGHGVIEVDHRLPRATDTLAERLRRAGYATEGIVSHTLLKRNLNFHQGFERYDQRASRDSHHKISTDGVTRRAKAALRRLADGARPFFLFLHFFDPHFNYNRHPECGFAARSAGRLDGSETIYELRSMVLTDEEVSFIQDLYDDEICHTDGGVGRVLEFLRDLDLYDDTLIVLTADHGEEFLAHGWLGHTRTLYDELIHVPLIIRQPGQQNGRTVDRPVSLAALTPTVLDLVGLDASDPVFQATSLAPLMRGEIPEGPPVVFSEVDFEPPKGTRRTKTAHKRALILERFKLVRDETTRRVELYETSSDPGELSNLSRQRPELVERLLLILDEQIELAERQAPDADRTSLSRQQLKELSALGYVD